MSIRDVTPVVRRLKATFSPNCAFCDTPMKFGTKITWTMLIHFKTGPQLKYVCDGLGGHFTKWPPLKTLGIFKVP